MLVSCPVCDNADGLELIREERILEVRKEPITVMLENYICSKCGEEFRAIEAGNDPQLERAIEYIKSQ